MKKRFIKKVLILFIVICSIFLIGCVSQDDVSSMHSMIEALEADILDLEGQIEVLEEDLDKNEEDLKTLRQKYNESVSALRQAEKEIETLKTDSENEVDEVRLHLAKEYYLVVGDTFQLFYRSIVEAVDPYIYYIKLTGSVGHQYNRYYEFTPTKTGTYTLQVEICNNTGYVYATASTRLVVASATADTTTKNVLCIGDSLTAGGYWTAKGYSKYKAAGGNINLLGTCYQQGVHFEGYSGWQWSTFFTGDGTKASPFKSTTDPSGISFKEYCSKNKYSGIDEVYICLTWNGIGGRSREFSFLDSIGENAKKFIDQLHKEYPNCKITLLGIPCPSVNAGLGAYYELNLDYADNYGQFVTAQNYNDFLEEWCNMSEYKSFMRYVDVKGQFDSENNMPTEGKAVNTENTKQEQVGNAMGMHPSTNGYNQIGDAFFRALMKKWK